jgi:hypothetical protein
VKLIAAGRNRSWVGSGGAGAGSATILPGFAAVIGCREYASVGAGCATVPGAAHDTVTCVLGSEPQVRCSCSGSVVVGSGAGPVAAAAAGALSNSVPAMPPMVSAAPTAIPPPKKPLRETPDSPAAEASRSVSVLVDVGVVVT